MIQFSSSKPAIKGWCPGALRPMLSGDGLIVRIRPPAGRLDRAQAAGIAALADRYGNGVIDLTRRGNLQLRGVSDATCAELIDGLRALALIDPSDEIEARRNIIVTPFWKAGDGTQEIAAALALALSQPDAPALPPKFGFAVDTGEHPVLHDAPADVRIERRSGALVVRADGSSTCARVALDEAVPAAMALARWYAAMRADSPRKLRMAALQQQLPALFQTQMPPEAPTAPVRIGRSEHGWLVGIEFGQMSAQTLMALADHAPALRLSPWRMLLIEGAEHAPDAPGLITRADDPLLRVVACTGAPACPQAALATRPLARDMAPHVPIGTLLHVSGCAKGCAHHEATLTLVGTPAGIDLVRRGNAASTPDRYALPADQVGTELQRILHATPL